MSKRTHTRAGHSNPTTEKNRRRERRTRPSVMMKLFRDGLATIGGGGTAAERAAFAAAVRKLGDDPIASPPSVELFVELYRQGIAALDRELERIGGAQS